MPNEWAIFPSTELHNSHEPIVGIAFRKKVRENLGYHVEIRLHYYSVSRYIVPLPPDDPDIKVSAGHLQPCGDRRLGQIEEIFNIT